MHLPVLPAIQRTTATAASRVAKGVHIKGFPTGSRIPVTAGPNIALAVPVKDPFGNPFNIGDIITISAKQ